MRWLSFRGYLCERNHRSWVTRREAGQVELLGDASPKSKKRAEIARVLVRFDHVAIAVWRAKEAESSGA
jgi:hypothetical protein